MSSRCFAAALLLVLAPLAFSAAAEKWIVLAGNWNELSPGADETLGIVIKKAVKTALEKSGVFQVLYFSNETAAFGSAALARDAAVSNAADIVVFGSYYIEGDALFVTTAVYDALEGRYRLRKGYHGVVTVDVFDTIDEMAAAMTEKIRSVLPELTVESEVEVKRMRQTVYEGLKTKRLFLTRFGLWNDIGSREDNWISSGTGTVVSNAFQPFALNNSFLYMGFTFRLYDFRFDFSAYFPGFPAVDFRKISLEFKTMAFFDMGAYWYVPALDSRLALGFSFSSLMLSAGRRLEGTNSQLLQASLMGFMNAVYLPITLRAYWAFDGGLEVGGGISPLPNFSTPVTLFPPVELGACYFYSSWLGAEVRTVFSFGKLQVSENGRVMSPGGGIFWEVYLGGIYRVDFMNQPK